MVLGAPSTFLRGLFPPEEPCECNTLTVILPDFDSTTIKNLLGLLYTGSSAGDCHEDDLRELVTVLRLALPHLENDAKDEKKDFKISRSSSTGSRNQIKQSSVLSLTKQRQQALSSSSNDDDNEMVEVTPDLGGFVGTHFMSDMNGGGHSSAAHSEDESSSSPAQAVTPQLRLKKASNLLADPDPSQAINGGNGNVVDADSHDKQFLCRLCGRWDV